MDAPQKEPQDAGGEMMQSLVIAAMKLLYTNPQTVEQMAQALKGGEDKVSIIVFLTMQVVEQVKAQMQGANPDLAYAVASMVAPLVAEIGVKMAGMPDDPKILAAAMAKIRAMLTQKAGAPPEQAAPQEQPAEQAPPQAGIVAQAMEG